MSTDVEAQLATLGRHLDDTVGHVSTAEILMHANGGAKASAALEPGRRDTPKAAEPADRRPHWLVAVAAALIVVLVGSLAVIRSSDEDPPAPVDDPTSSTEVSETISPPTVPTVVDPPAPAPSFVATGSMEVDCFQCPAILLDDGRVFVGGSVIQVYDPATETFASVAQLEDYGGYADHSTLLADGRVMMASGNGDLVIFDPDTGLAETLRTENDPHQVPTGLDYTVQIPVALNDGRVLVFSQTGASLVDLTTGALSAAGTTANPLRNMIALPLLDGNVIVMGQNLRGDDLIVEVYDPDRGEFVPTGTPSLAMVDSVGAIRLLDGRILVIGSSQHAEIYDPVTGTFSQTGPATSPLMGSFSTMALLPDGRVLILDPTRDLTVVSNTEIFDPVTGTFVAGPTTMRPRFGATALTLQDGRVLVLGSYRGNAGGIPGDGPSSAELFSSG